MNSEYLAGEINNGNLDNNILYPAVKMGLHRELCDSLSSNIHTALRSWGLEELGADIQFVRCE